MSVVSCFKRVLCQSYICLFFVVVMSLSRSLGILCFWSGIVRQVGGFLFFSAVAVFFCVVVVGVLFFVQYCFVVTCYYLLHVGHAAVAEFYCVSVQ